MKEVSPSPQFSLTIHPTEFQFIAIFCSMFKQPQMFPIHNLVPLEEYSHLQQTVFKDGHSNPSPLPLQSHFSEVANGHSQTIKQKWIWTGLGHFLKAEFGCINLCLYIVQLWKRSHNYGPASVSFNLPSVSSGREKKEVPIFHFFFFFWLPCVACGTPVLPLGIKPRNLTLGVWSLTTGLPGKTHVASILSKCFHSLFTFNTPANVYQPSTPHADNLLINHIHVHLVI